MSEENKQVKFLRKTPTDFNNITNKDQNTFYHVVDDKTNELYFGNEKLTNSEDIFAIETEVAEKFEQKEIEINEKIDTSLKYIC